MAEFKVGDEVAYSRKFLRSICEFSGWKPFARGEIEEVVACGKDFTLLRVKWLPQKFNPGQPAQSTINARNMIHVERIPLEPV